VEEVTGLTTMTHTHPREILSNMLQATNPRAGVRLTVTVANDGRRFREHLKVGKFNGSRGLVLRVEVENSGVWNRARRQWDVRPIVLGYADARTGHFTPDADPRATPPLMQYVARVAVRYLGTGDVPTPANGKVEIEIQPKCVSCGIGLHDEESLRYLLGRECRGGRSRARGA
jgi:hypothetical protein